ncbi:ribosome maturation factor RimP [Eubacteriales bacterium OttesenSCG-928-K08]|nr:ribosome maturation factor RimP [Eubacteriales bacterium OttesenSCG-928-K08]
MDIVTTLVKKPIEDMGYELIDLEFKKEQSDWVLTIFIDKEGGVTLNDCEAVSRVVDPILDEHDPIEQSYYLSVSSPGLDRPLKTERDFQRNINKPVVVKLYAQVEKKKEFTGELKEFSEQEITIACNDGSLRTFLKKDVAQVKPHIEFS